MSDPKMVFASFTPAEGQTEAVRSVLQTVRTGSRSEPGCEQYDVLSASTEDGATRFHIYERYTDDDALQAHRDSEHYKAYRAAIVELLAEPIGVIVLTEVD